MIIVMLGAPGTGKGTMSTYISKYYEIPHISTGDLFRDEIKKNGENSSKIKEFMEKGELVPDEYILKMVEDRIKKIDCRDGFILDGFPRNILQADELYQMLKKNKFQLDAVINLEVPKEEIIDRIVNRLVCPKCKAIYNLKTKKPLTEWMCDKCDSKLVRRPDDTEEKVVTRLEEYYNKTYDLIEYYKKTGKLFTIETSIKLNKSEKDILKEIDWNISKNK